MLSTCPHLQDWSDPMPPPTSLGCLKGREEVKRGCLDSNKITPPVQPVAGTGGSREEAMGFSPPLAPPETEVLHRAKDIIQNQQKDLATLRQALEDEATVRRNLTADLERTRQTLLQRNRQVEAMASLLHKEMGIKMDLELKREVRQQRSNMMSPGGKGLQMYDQSPGHPYPPAPIHESNGHYPTGLDQHLGGDQEQLAQQAQGVGMVTVGAKYHAQGNCKPCFYAYSKAGCGFGRSCVFCHLDHARRKKERPPKIVRQECKNIAKEVFQTAVVHGGGVEADSEDLLRQRQELLNAGSVTGKYASSVLRALYRQNPGKSEDSSQEGGWSV
ncbi:unnamed protein product [Polarella glacialis]|uniref:C3H1-type domain-containing protein n=1 Tax=Polarella glacialis TaxID=89957 RepID=A0A813H0V5_POLGL|nr:unnamed protein product [Polarella glacialis]